MVTGVIRLKCVMKFECPNGDQVVTQQGTHVDQRICTNCNIPMIGYCETLHEEDLE